MLNPFTHRKILKKGRPARAVISGMAMPDGGAVKQRLPMTLEVHAEGAAPYVVQDEWIVASKDSLGFGMELAVRVDPDDPEKVAIDWEASRELRSSEREAQDSRLAGQAPVTTFGAGAAAADEVAISVGGEEAATGAADPVAQIERLAKLRDAGALTDEEFEQQKQKLLGRL